jgi:hypothetical protein
VSDETVQWLHNFKQLIFFVEVAQDNFQVAPNSRGVAEKSTKEGLRHGVFHHLLEERERKAIYSTQLSEIVDPVLAAVVRFLDEQLTSPQQLVNSLGEIARLAANAVDSIDAMPDEEDVEQVVDEFETRYLATLATTMSAHHTLATKLVGRKDSDGQYFDVGRYVFVSEPGPGRVHVADLNYAMDGGANSLSFKRGFVSYERFPPIQVMTYGQWFAYIHAIWDEWYRPRLAGAYSRQLGEEFSKNDVQSVFMGELNKIRNDVIHNKSRVKESARNSILNWGTSDGLVGMTTERMMSLRTSFPRDELMTPPVHGDVPKTQNIPWTADIQLIDSVKQRLSDLGVTKRQQKDIGDEMLRLWLGANSMSKATETDQASAVENYNEGSVAD